MPPWFWNGTLLLGQLLLQCAAVLTLMTSFVYRMSSEILCWGRRRNQIAFLDNVANLSRVLTAIASGGLYWLRCTPVLRMILDTSSRCDFPFPLTFPPLYSVWYTS